MAKPGAPKQGEFVALPELEWLKFEITEAVIEEGEYQGKPRTQVKVTLECVEDDYEGGRMTYWAGFSLHEKSKLTPLAEAVTGLSGDALIESFDTDDLVGKKVMVIGKNVIVKAKTPGDEDRTFLKPTMFKAVGRKGAAATQAEKAQAAAVLTTDEPAGLDI
jgi:hypothetical protein